MVFYVYGEGRGGDMTRRRDEGGERMGEERRGGGRDDGGKMDSFDPPIQLHQVSCKLANSRQL